MQSRRTLDSNTHKNSKCRCPTNESYPSYIEKRGGQTLSLVGTKKRLKAKGIIAF